MMRLSSCDAAASLMRDHSPIDSRGNRRGMAMIATMILTTALGALALSAIYLSSGTRLGSKLTDKAQTLNYAADAALQMGKSYINADPDAMPETGFREITFNGGVMPTADGGTVPGVTVRTWAGPTGATSGQFGAFGSIIAEATDLSGGKVIRRLELAQENFARFAYWSNRESNGVGPIWFGSGDVIFGPAWSNDTIRVRAKGALPWSVQFRDDLGTAKYVMQNDQGDFWKGFSEWGKPIAMPLPASLPNLQSFAAPAQLAFVAPTAGDETTVRMRIEFVNIDIDNDGRDTDPQDGFVRVYTLKAGGRGSWLRGDGESVATPSDAHTRRNNCGEWIRVGTVDRFFTIDAHERPAVAAYLRANGVDTAAFDFSAAPGSAPVQAILSRTGVPSWNRSQCFLGGAPELNMGLPAGHAGGVFGGTSRTFRASDPEGDWQTYTGPYDGRVVARRGAVEAAYLFPLHRSLNAGARGVINVTGTVGISGRLVGRITLHSTGTIVVLDDIQYGTNPATSGRCVDVLGLLSDVDVVVADNALNNQTDVVVGSGGTDWKILDDTKDLTIHSVIMALNTSFRVENFAGGPTNGNPCIGNDRGRGCLYLLGGLIQEARGAVGTSGAGVATGYGKQYSYDRCANLRPPPYFPTTGRYLDNRYMEIDPVGFNISSTFSTLAPAP
jgi:hypothetical protein